MMKKYGKREHCEVMRVKLNLAVAALNGVDVNHQKGKKQSYSYDET